MLFVILWVLLQMIIKLSVHVQDIPKETSKSQQSSSTSKKLVWQRAELKRFRLEELEAARLPPEISKDEGEGGMGEAW
ncbi:hypothetical protein RRG08_021743 [Elysia crispata]|uniref:Uncharacterized protein n=1 Tax=Elysia crispata TaxID=231223 RepID=A0AAE0ZZU8_9GAST|nr:hypothetical protein RRG08_021743 [Elysia crispata]